MGLISNLAVVFSSTFSNIEGGPGPELRDMDAALTKAINDHIAQPAGNRAFVAANFGTVWNGSYSAGGLPTRVLTSHGTYIDPLIAPIIADAMAFHLNAVGVLMLATAPPIAIAAVGPVAAALGSVPGGAPIAATMTTAVTSAQAIPAGGGLPTIPSLVSTGILGLAGLVTALRLTPALGADLVSLLDFQLQSIGLVGATSARPAAWAAVSGQISAIPPNPELAGPLGANFWQAILLTIQQAVPGVRAI